MKTQRNIIIISASSDIGTEMCMRYKSKGWDVFGTYKTDSINVEKLKKLGVKLFHCDLLSKQSVIDALDCIGKKCLMWDVLVLCVGTQKPVVRFTECDFNEWEESVSVNFIRQIFIVKELLPSRNLESPRTPCVLFFAGGGTNNATVNYSAYTVSKIALIKMCELLDAEIPDTRFSILGPGWVKTKIHEETLQAEEKAGDNFQKTKYKLSSDECTPMSTVLDSCEWIINSPRKIIGGRNFSAVYDMWGTPELENILQKDDNMYKLRRFGNDRLIKK